MTAVAAALERLAAAPARVRTLAYWAWVADAFDGLPTPMAA